MKTALAIPTSLKQMGADIELFTQCLGARPCRFASQNFHHNAIIKGTTPLTSKDFSIPDLRGGFAYVMAALIAPDVSHLSGAHFLDRGYENLVGKLSGLGADISRSDENVRSTVLAK